MTTAQEELTWKRQPNGQYVTRHGFWVFTAFRSDIQPPGRQWCLEGYPEGNLEAKQTRCGFDRLSTAKLAVFATRCSRCNRWREFRELEPYVSERKIPRSATPRPLSQGTFQCRDHESCQAEQDRQAAEIRNFEWESRQVDADEIDIFEDEYGPQLRIAHKPNRTVINVTEADLDKIAELIAARRQARE